MDKWDELIDAALREAPLAEPPAYLAASIARRVRQAPQLAGSPAASLPAVRPAFRLTWLDYALWAFIAVMLATVAFISGTLPPELAHYWGQELGFWAESLLFDLRLLPAGYLLLLGSLAAGALLSALAFWAANHTGRA